MKIIWLGQSGLLLVSGKKKIVIDPYLSDSMKKTERSMSRGMRVNKHFFHIKPDLLILTNASPDHTDIKTVTKYISKCKRPLTVLCSEKSYDRLIETQMPRRYNKIVFEEGSEWTLENIRLEAIVAKSNDRTGFGLIITDSLTGKVYYYASDTVYSKYLFDDIPEHIDTAFIPINGENGCMNISDAERYVQYIPAKHIVPIHYGMFDNTDPKKFNCDRVVIPKIYKVLPIDAEDENDEFSEDTKKKKKVVHKSLSSAIKQEKAEEKERIFAEKMAVEIRKQLEKEAAKIEEEEKKKNQEKEEQDNEEIKKKLFKKKRDSEEDTLISDILSNTLEIALVSGGDAVKSPEIIREDTRPIDETGEVEVPKESPEVVRENSRPIDETGEVDIPRSVSRADVEEVKDNSESERKAENKLPPNFKTPEEFMATNKNLPKDFKMPESISMPNDSGKVSDDDVIATGEVFVPKSLFGNRSEEKNVPEFDLPKRNNERNVSDEDKIDAYVKEIEKFQRGDTADFKKIDVSSDDDK